MKSPRLLLLAGLLGLAAVARADDNPFKQLQSPFEPDPTTLAAPDADMAFKPLPELASMDGLMAAVAGKTKQEERLTALRLHIVKVLRVGTAFCQKYPDDPRRWRVVQTMATAMGDLANADGTPKEVLDGVTWDPAVFAAWHKQVAALSAAAATAPDAPPETRYRAEAAQPDGLRERSSAAQKAIAAKQPADFASYKAELLRLAAKYPTVEALGQQSNIYFLYRTRAGTPKEEILAELDQFIAGSNAAITRLARIERDKLTGFADGFTLTFTAVDGRKVDIKDYRGKVVLVDFWATWCGPCVAEIPNIKKVYADYHAKGFDIIGVSLENASIKSSDTPDATAAKHEKAKKVLTDYTAKAGMPWPQYYDGKFWKNDISTRFGITGIPAMFLLDQDGKIVSTEARGPALEAEVKRLLKL